ncbi:TIGR03617 family F420-dependent LLM class oxidoreductase [Nocardioides sp.]|uniref:TIGR03617 family F420-dependent LLM class oxidoreductase n=1 Tax=Nocardioides sp. TaxID=35761 RepID=UPI0035636E5F
MELVASWPAESSLSQVGDYARRVEALGFDVMHVPETTHDPFTVCALALDATQTLVLRTSMVVAFPRSPMVTALAAWDLSRFSGGRFQLGIASQVRGNIVGRYSAEWSEPVTRLRDYVLALRAIFAAFQTGEPLSYQGAVYTFDRLQPYFNPGPLPHQGPSIWTGAVNVQMTTMAGEVADGFVCHPTHSHPRVLRDLTRPALLRGAARSGREDGGPAVVVGPQPIMAASRQGLEVARENRRADLAFLYSTPAYRTQLAAFGLDDLGERLSAMAAADQWEHLDRHLNDEVIDMLVPVGTYAELPGVLEEWYSGTCAGIGLSVPAEPTDPAEDVALRDLVEACRSIPVG